MLLVPERTAALPAWRLACRKIAVAAVVATVACSPAGGGGDDVPESRSDAGARVVENPAVPRLGEASGEVFRFELEQRFGTDDGPFETILTTIAGGAAVDDRGNLYLVMRGPRVVSFAPDGSLRWSVERQGQAPGELARAVCCVAWDGGGSIFLINGTTRIDQWSTDGEFVASRAVANLVPGRSVLLDLAGIVDERTLVFAEAYPGHVGSTLIFIDAAEPEWELVAQHAIDLDEGDELPEARSERPDVGVAGGTITMGNRGDYSLRFFGAGGDLRLVARVASERFLRVEDPESGGLEPRGEVRQPMRLASGYWLVHARWPVAGGEGVGGSAAGATGGEARATFRSALDLFDADGDYLASQVSEGSSPEIGFPLMTGPDGRLYTICADEFMQICRYRVELDVAGYQ